MRNRPQDRRCPRNCDRRAVALLCHWVSAWEGRAAAKTREPGDLPVTVDLSRGRGAPGGRGEPSCERRHAAARIFARGPNEGPCR